jgi:hypothetical protein
VLGLAFTSARSISAPVSQLVVFPSFECELDVVLLALFRSTAEKDDYLFAFFPKIHSVKKQQKEKEGK